MKSKIPPIEIDTSEYEKFKLLTKSEGKTMSKAVREMIINYNKNSNKLNKRSKELGLGSLMAKEYGINLKGTGVTSTNYKEFLYGDL